MAWAVLAVQFIRWPSLIRQSGHQFADWAGCEELLILPSRDGALEDVAEHVGASLLHLDHNPAEYRDEPVDRALSRIAIHIWLHRLEVFLFSRATGECTDCKRQEDVDLYVALVGGLIDAQLANDPGGDRWGRLLHRTIDMFADNLGIQPHDPRRRL